MTGQVNHLAHLALGRLAVVLAPVALAFLDNAVVVNAPRDSGITSTMTPSAAEKALRRAVSFRQVFRLGLIVVIHLSSNSLFLFSLPISSKPQ
jgi:hypothetical protein